jgi:hypothetical protein
MKFPLCGCALQEPPGRVTLLDEITRDQLGSDAIVFYLIACSCHTSLTVPSSRLAALASPKASSSACEMVPSKETGISENLTFVEI